MVKAVVTQAATRGWLSFEGGCVPLRARGNISPWVVRPPPPEQPVGNLHAVPPKLPNINSQGSALTLNLVLNLYSGKVHFDLSGDYTLCRTWKCASPASAV